MTERVTGHGDRVQGDCNDAMMKEATQKISIMAGLATFNFKKVRTFKDWEVLQTHIMRCCMGSTVVCCIFYC